MGGFQGLDILTKSFVSPMMANAVYSMNASVQSQLFPSPQMYSPPAAEPWQYLGPTHVYLPASWWGTLHFLGSLSSITAVYVGIGAIAGASVAGCLGNRKVEVEESEALSESSTETVQAPVEPDVFENDPEKQLKEEVIKIF